MNRLLQAQNRLRRHALPVAAAIRGWGSTPRAFGIGDAPGMWRSNPRKGGALDFDPSLFNEKDWVELIVDENSKLYNFGPRLVKHMRALKDRVYLDANWPRASWLKNESKAYREAKFAEEEKKKKALSARRKVPYVRMGDFSNTTEHGKNKRPLGDFDRLVVHKGTTSCSPAVLEALYRSLGGRIDESTGRVTSVGGVNGVPLTDAKFSGFPMLFQGPKWIEALIECGLGYGVDMRELRLGDMIQKPGHRLVYLRTVETYKSDDPNGRYLKGDPKIIKTIESKPPTGNPMVDEYERKVPAPRKWQAARIYDIRKGT